MSTTDKSNEAASKTPHRLALLPAAMFVVMMLAGLGVTVQSLRNVPESAWAGFTEPTKLLGGESTRQFTSNLNDHFLPSHFFAQVERAVTWTLVGDTGAQVGTGCSDWFFLTEELETFPHPQQSAQARADIVAAVAKNLKAQGIDLVVALVPDKTRIEQAHLCGLHRSPLFAQRLSQWQTALTQAGVNVLNLEPVLSALPGERYYRTDSHWNESGSDAAALAIAKHLKGASGVPSAEAAQMNRQTADRPGDLFRLSNLEGLPALLRPPVEKAQITTLAAAPAVPAAGADDLFGDAALPTVVVVGTSFSRTSNFVPFLSHYMGAEVANLAKDGGNFEGSALAYLGSPTFEQTPPKTIVWEVPERMLQKPLSKAEQQWMRDLKLRPAH
ncbi:alginate O-acetylase AlgJ [Rhodoferax lithotrophicus]|uniref:Alginate O-acetylase AlgJ n=1 Tax=Rhodoferax lithotrophicus TaxID=2798804 RepID=A0ABM7MQR8_9BURK|nr:cell division protein FtsQ [Rhodoferax sp. MIZ03]BCO28717.1 alginate O-acetylase AlgJ [Rhodoferax sp. MIZ03]